MTIIHIEDVERVLRLAPTGLTTAEVAEKLHQDTNKVSGRLSKLAAYGSIAREYERRDGNNLRRCRWRLKEMAHA